MKKLIGTWRLNVPVAVVADLSHKQARTLIHGVKGDDCWDNWTGYEPRDLLVEIDYPLGEPVELKVNPHKESYANIGLLLRVVALKYKEIYKKPAKYGIFGHGIDDLYFESITIKEDGRVSLGIGS